MSHILTAPSSAPEATHLESGDSYKQFILPLCSLKVLIAFYYLTSQTLILVSSDPVTRMFDPVQSLLRQVTFAICPTNFATSFLEARSHTCTVPPTVPEMIYSAFAEKVNSETPLLCPLRVYKVLIISLTNFG